MIRRILIERPFDVDIDIDPCFVLICSNVWIGTLRLLVAPTADTHKILSQTHHIFMEVRENYFMIMTTKLTTHPTLSTIIQLRPGPYCCPLGEV